MVFYLGASIVWLMLGPLKGATKEQRRHARRLRLQQQLAELGTTDALEPGATAAPALPGEA
jgi:hypothetical protein